MDTAKAVAELKILRGFVDFVNLQIGVYCDCIAGFQGNKVRVERRIARRNYPKSRHMENGLPVVIWASVEDPTKTVLHHRIIRTDEFIKVNSEAEFNEQQMCWSIIVFVYANWDEEIRPQLAKIRGVKPDDIKIDVFGDLRILRRGIIHNGGVISSVEYRKLKVLHEICQSESKMSFNHDEMHKLFIFMKRALGELILFYARNLPGAPKAEEIDDIAIQLK